ncbi:MAG TPA: YihA family ribosome biogenesis GTP-binding protein [Gammaproteobacteria bacterium]|nr:YihA family ribosome biogenesis GTP-binding protein [Gammaproteobacteria bacterium]|tara:strand:- start:188 stop:817 length:630 start_codon:yes stop_codon:yes gene_type:complete
MSILESPKTFSFSNVKFVKEAHLLRQMPTDIGAEIAFAGRSNAGKSSIINTLCNRRKLARTSRTPGRTQQFVVYEFGTDRRIIDLPGFGFAKVSKNKRDHWSLEIPRYLEQRRSLVGLILVVDSRHRLKEQELELLGWCKSSDLPTLLLLNKADKLNQKETSSVLRDLGRDVDGLAPGTSVQLFSAKAPLGVDSALGVIAGWFESPETQ